jgi:hypothetical protein
VFTPANGGSNNSANAVQSGLSPLGEVNATASDPTDEASPGQASTGQTSTGQASPSETAAAAPTSSSSSGASAGGGASPGSGAGDGQTSVSPYPSSRGVSPYIHFKVGSI